MFAEVNLIPLERHYVAKTQAGAYACLRAGPDTAQRGVKSSTRATKAVMQQAIDSQELVVHYQPKVERGSGEFLARALSDAARPLGRLEPEMAPARNFGADILSARE